MKYACCIVAAGRGTRLGDKWANTPKALVPILGRPMLYYSLSAFSTWLSESEDLGEIGRFIITAPPEFISDFEEEVDAWGFPRPIKVIPGGATRAESVYNALREIVKDKPEMVMIHDAARACLTTDMVDMLLQASSTGHAASLAHKATDTLRNIEENIVAGEVDRDKISCLETPQIFPCSLLLELHAQAEGNIDPPDDTTLFTRAGETVKVVNHEGCNLKVTFPDDIGAAEGILFSRGWQDVSEGED